MRNRLLSALCHQAWLREERARQQRLLPRGTARGHAVRGTFRGGPNPHAPYGHLNPYADTEMSM